MRSLLLFLIATALTAQETLPHASVRVAGEIRFKKTAPVFLRLLALDEAKQAFVAREQIIEIKTEDIARGTLRFEFAGLAPGHYALKCFQDVNGNKKLDIGMFGPKEPWSTYRLARPKFRRRASRRWPSTPRPTS